MDAVRVWEINCRGFSSRQIHVSFFFSFWKVFQCFLDRSNRRFDGPLGVEWPRIIEGNMRDIFCFVIIKLDESRICEFYGEYLLEYFGMIGKFGRNKLHGTWLVEPQPGRRKRGWREETRASTRRGKQKAKEWANDEGERRLPDVTYVLGRLNIDTRHATLPPLHRLL